MRLPYVLWAFVALLAGGVPAYAAASLPALQSGTKAPPSRPERGSELAPKAPRAPRTHAPEAPSAGASQPGIAALVAGGSDDCATADAIAGPGPFAFDNTLATTGTQGQTELACFLFDTSAVKKDVWFAWTASFTGTAELTTCASPVDTKVAVYAGAGCPASPALGCNDDHAGCGANGYQSRVLFPTVGGQVYTLQIGVYPFGVPGGAGSFQIAQVGAPTNDGCATATAIAGTGMVPFDTTFASTGSEGQSEMLCGAGAQAPIESDVWFTWTASASGRYVLDTRTASYDTKVAIRSGAGCPAGAALACSDDACGERARFSWNATNGQSFTFQVGASPGATGGPGAFSVALAPANDSCATPIVIAGTGTFPFDLRSSTTGVEGQGATACLFAGSTAVANDAWYRWTATFSGFAQLTTCGSHVDTKVAVYAGSGCPAAAPLDCNDDFCGPSQLQSRVVWPVISGQVYTIQLGTYPLLCAGAQGSFEIVTFVPKSNDSCATPTAVVGPGPHAFDNQNATTSAEGQANAICQFFGNAAIVSDLWYAWMAPATGTYKFSLCGGAALDSKIAVYAGFGCPLTQALACNDDKCVLTSEVCFDAVVGQTFTLQLGLHPGPGAAGGAGTFTLTPVPMGVTNDDCVAATPIAGLGPHAYDTTNASTGCQGQDNASCSFFGQTGIDSDLWYRWTAPTTERYQVSLCGLSAARDTKVAVYLGGGCPTASAVACDDDGCGLAGGESRTCFDAIAGQQYTVQVGSYPGSPGGPGAFQFATVSAPAGCTHDNGSSENAYGLANGGELLWLARYGAPGRVTTVSSVSAAFGTSAAPGLGPVPGTLFTVAVWDDPDDDGQPANAQLLAQATGLVAARDNDAFTTVTLATPVSAHGYLFVGVKLAHDAGRRPASLDQDNCPSGSQGRAWVGGSTVGPLDLSNLASSNIPLAELDLLGLPGVWLLRAGCTTSAGSPYCAGDGNGTPCPCGNSSSMPNTGCQHSQSVSANGGAGARLEAVGLASIAADSVLLRGTQMPLGTQCLFFQGTAQTATAFGDGLRCVTGATRRLGLRTVTGGVRDYGFGVPGDVAISIRGQILTPGTRYYALWFRNGPTFCTIETFNLTNGVRIDWAL